MSDAVLELQALAPLLLRDGRPFAGGGEESRAQSLPLPLPHTLAGFIRTQLGAGRGLDWQMHDDAAFKRVLQNLHGDPVRSLLLRDGKFMFPAPLNALVDKEGKAYRSSPGTLGDGEGCNLPPVTENVNLRPLLLESELGENFKPEGGYTYWPMDAMKTWLLGDIPPQPLEKIGGPPAEERTHVSIDSKTGAGVKGDLFSVTYRGFEERKRLDDKPEQERGRLPSYTHHRWTVRIKTDVQGGIAKLGHLGGERRPVALKNLGNRQMWPNIGEFSEVAQALETSPHLCFILTSPALFKHGWKPAWLDLTANEAARHSGEGLPAGIKHVAGRVRLVGAALGRRIAVSGWNLRTNTPKAVRWAVPAGSVYFLEVTRDFDRQKLLDAWLKPLSDSQNDQRDGFGCALWGVWKP